MLRVLLSLTLVLLVLGCNRDEPNPRRSARESREGRNEPGPKKVPFPGFPHDDPAVRVLEGGTKVLDEKLEGFKHARVAEVGRNVELHYTGWLTDGTPFESSWDSNQPTPFQLSEDGAIKGFVAGVSGMREGGVRLIFIPAKEGYGDRPNGPIPPNSDLIFRIHLIEVKDAPPGPVDHDAGK